MVENTENAYLYIMKAYNEGDVFISVDIETTGLDPRKDQIVEIGAVKFDKKGPIARYSTFINPGIPMPPEAGKINNITDKMLAGQPFFKEILPDFLAFVKKHHLIAHNAPFDFGFINENLKKHGGTESNLSNSITDTLVFSRDVFPGRPSYSLQNLSAYLGIKTYNAHRAEDDARLCAEIFIQCLESCLRLS